MTEGKRPPPPPPPLAQGLDPPMLTCVGILNESATTFPDEFKSHFQMRRKAVHSRGHAHIMGNVQAFSYYLLKLVVANPLQ